LSWQAYQAGRVAQLWRSDSLDTRRARGCRVERGASCTASRGVETHQLRKRRAWHLEALASAASGNGFRDGTYDTDLEAGASTRTVESATTGISVGNPTSNPGISGTVDNPTSNPGINGSVSLNGTIGVTNSPTDGPAYVVLNFIIKT
jgi:hypothetical protein